MKKLVSLFIAAAAVFSMAVCVYAAEGPSRFLGVVPENDASAEEISSFAAENGFGGILLDLRGQSSVDFYEEILSSSGEKADIFVLGDIAVLSKLPAEAKIIVQNGISEEDFSALSEKHGAENISFMLPFDDEGAFSTAEYYLSKGFYKTIFAENLLSCHSELGYEDYLLKISEKFPDAEIITINDLGRVLAPVLKGDFYGDIFELNNQYLINKIHGVGFCVSDYSDIIENRNGSGTFLLEYFESTVLDEYGVFSISDEFAITRPTKSTLYVATEKYSIFGTSDPEKPLYMDGVEVERISTTGLFSVRVEVPKNGQTFTFSQGGKTLSVTLTGTPTSSGTSTTKKLSSISPSADVILEEGETKVTISCVGPSGASVKAKIGDKTVTLKQKAYADPGVPATFSAEITLPDDFPEDEVTLIGNAVYTLSYGGNVTEYESAGGFYFLGSEAVLSVKATVDLAGIERAPGDSGDYITTLRTGCVENVLDIDESGWYKVSCGGYIKPSHCEIITGKAVEKNVIASAERVIGENYEKLVLDCSVFPAFVGKTDGKVFSLTLYNTEWTDLHSTSSYSELMNRIDAINNRDGSITVNFHSKVDFWGWDIFTDEENGTFEIVLKGTPTLSDDKAKPLSGIVATVCSGHGGPDPGALSVAGEDGVNEAQINLVNTLMIAEALEDLGAEIVLITTDDEKLDSYQRTDPARYSYSDVYICCHANAVAESAAANLWCGTYVYYHYDHSAEFAKNLCDYISASTRRDNEGSEAGYYSVTRLTMCPAVMLEVGFVSNPKELESLIDPRDIQKTAYAVTKATLELFDN